MDGSTGRLLVATPGLRDPSFRRSVVLVLEHTSGGALGVVLDRPLEVDVAAVLPGWRPHVSAPGVLFAGGPVGRDAALGLAGVPDGTAAPPGVRPLVPGLGLVDLDAPPEVVAQGVRGLRVFVGYAGWSGGQLDEEIDAKGWIVVDALPGDPFAAEPTALWRRVLRRQRDETALLWTAPDDPALN
ncbi:MULTISPECIES: YqgE/AlgH family protein [Cellulomonas]|uniref:YqgE/AlgH family protein n=1 Tax=Cellulomonas TaxID=1707 RepID=UPI001CA3A7BF|nr:MULTISPECIES: YqgE/AlgH family protein [Cellulomonas]